MALDSTLSAPLPPISVSSAPVVAEHHPRRHRPRARCSFRTDSSGSLRCLLNQRVAMPACQQGVVARFRRSVCSYSSRKRHALDSTSAPLPPIRVSSAPPTTTLLISSSVSLALVSFVVACPVARSTVIPSDVNVSVVGIEFVFCQEMLFPVGARRGNNLVFRRAVRIQIYQSRDRATVYPANDCVDALSNQPALVLSVWTVA